MRLSTLAERMTQFLISHHPKQRLRDVIAFEGGCAG
jgi:hypothetical protein